MMRRNKIILFGFLLIFGLIYWLAENTFNVGMKSVIKDYVIDFKELDDKIYISARSWGISGNHQEIILSSSPISSKHRGYSKQKNYIFYTSEIYYKKTAGNELIVYVSNSLVSKPKKFSSPIHIVLKDIGTSDELKNYERNYKKYGLEKISI